MLECWNAGMLKCRMLLARSLSVWPVACWCSPLCLPCSTISQPETGQSTGTGGGTHARGLRRAYDSRPHLARERMEFVDDPTLRPAPYRRTYIPSLRPLQHCCSLNALFVSLQCVGSLVLATITW